MDCVRSMQHAKVKPCNLAITQHTACIVGRLCQCHVIELLPVDFLLVCLLANLGYDVYPGDTTALSMYVLHVFIYVDKLSTPSVSAG
jgi:hypothetical protein